jgi:quinol monooxygenase YgiN
MPGMTIVAKVRPGKREKFLQAARSLGNGGEKHEGLKTFTVSEEAGDRNSLSLVYEWDAQKDMERFLDAEKFSVLLGALRVLCEQSHASNDEGMT